MTAPEHGDPYVGENEVLCQEVEQGKELFGDWPWLPGHVVVGVVGLTDTAEKDSHDSSQMKHLEEKWNLL